MIGEVNAIAKTFEEQEVAKICGTSYGPRDGHCRSEMCIEKAF